MERNVAGGRWSVLVHALMYGNETMIWKENEELGIELCSWKTLERGVLGIRRIDRIPMHWLESCRADKWLDEKVLSWLGCIERRENCTEVYKRSTVD